MYGTALPGNFRTAPSVTIECVFTDVELRAASPDEVEDVLAVLNAAARRLRDQAIRQWPAAFEADWVKPSVLSGETWVARRARVPIATITLGWTDPLWPDDGLAGYVHRLARTDDAVGIGDHLLRWAGDRVLQHRRTFVRLDCIASNPGLRAFYETRGFVHRGDADVGGPPGSRSSEGAVTVVSLYERHIARRRRQQRHPVTRSAAGLLHDNDGDADDGDPER